MQWRRRASESSGSASSWRRRIRRVALRLNGAPALTRRKARHRKASDHEAPRRGLGDRARLEREVGERRAVDDAERALTVGAGIGTQHIGGATLGTEKAVSAEVDF